MSIFENYPPGSWTVRGDKLIFPVQEIDEDGGNRIVRRARPYRDGAKLDDTGSKEKVWRITVVFENSIEEDGLDPNRPLYPFVLNALIASFDLHDTGDLVLPTRGLVRCRAESYSRKETYGEVDSATVVFTFVQDNEDNVDALSFQQPTVRSTVQRAQEDATFTMESLGGFSQMLADLEDAAGDLQDAIAAPGEMIQDVDQKAARVVRIATDVERQFMVTGQLGRDLLTDPDAWATQRQLRILQDRTLRAIDEKHPQGTPVVNATFATTRSIYDIATEFQQNAVDLINLNSAIPNLLSIPAGTPVRVFDD